MVAEYSDTIHRGNALPAAGGRCRLQKQNIEYQSSGFMLMNSGIRFFFVSPKIAGHNIESGFRCFFIHRRQCIYEYFLSAPKRKITQTLRECGMSFRTAISPKKSCRASLFPRTNPDRSAVPFVRNGISSSLCVQHFPYLAGREHFYERAIIMPFVRFPSK